jgi:hypothetical protein
MHENADNKDKHCTAFQKMLLKSDGESRGKYTTNKHVVESVRQVDENEGDQWSPEFGPSQIRSWIAIPGTPA